MDKYEYKLKLDQMKTLAAAGDYATAAEIADSINWRKVKNVNLLMKAGDIYSKQKRYDDARDILLMAYDRSPIGRMIIYRLAEIAVKMKSMEEAEEYYDEFVELAPHDNLKYVLRYKISKAKGADIRALIAILEELKEAEYTEEWAYQLAFLYHKAGDSEKCIDACDELILWFGDGIYVERALELKMLYQPLTKAQEDKYRAFKRNRGIETGTRPMEEDAVRIPVVQENVGKFNTANLQEELAKSMRQIMEATEKETVDDTMDSIKKMVEDIPYLQMPHHEEKTGAAAGGHIETDEEIDDTLRDNFKELLAEDHDGQYSILLNDKERESQIDGQMSIEDVLSNWEKTRRAVKAALTMAQQQKLESAKARALQEAGDIMERLAEVMPKLDAGITPTQLLQEEYLSGSGLSNEERASKLMAGMNNMLQQQIDRLQEEAGGERAAVAETENESELLKKVKKAKPNFDEQIGLRPYIPRQFDQTLPQQEEVPKQKEQAAEEEIIIDDALSEEMRLAEAEFYRISPEELDRRQREAGKLSEERLDQMLDDMRAKAPDRLSDGMGDHDAGQMPGEEAGAAEQAPDGSGTDAAEQLPGGMETDAAGQLPGGTKTDVAGQLPSGTETDAAGQLPDGMAMEAAEPKAEPESVLLKQTTKKIKAKKVEEALEQASGPSAGQKEPEEAKAVSKPQEMPEAPEQKNGEQAADKQPAIEKLNEEQKAIFSYFVPVAGMEQQICKVLSSSVSRFASNAPSGTGNILIQGGNGCGKTVLATALIKALQKELKRPNAKIGKIDAEVLNKKDLAKLMAKIAGGFLIIERAGGLDRETAVRLSLLLEQDKSGIMVIMEDTRTGLNEALLKDEGLSKKFTERIKIPIFTSDELVEFGKAYAHDLDYEIDTMGVLALYNRISNIQRLDQPTTLTEVKEIVDEAIAKADKKSIKKALSIITSRRYTNDDYIILREKDFEE